MTNLAASIRNKAVFAVLSFSTVTTIFGSSSAFAQANCAAVLPESVVTLNPALMKTKDAKMNYVFDRFKTGVMRFTEADNFARQIQVLSPEEQANWMDAIGTVYRTMPKRDLNPLGAKKFGGRRSLDRITTLILKTHVPFKANPANPRELFDKTVSDRMAMYRADYDIQDVWTVIDRIQEHVKAYEAGMNGRKLPIILAGSFINGKARLAESDMDISVWDTRMLNGTKELAEKINAELMLRHPESKLTFEPHAMGSSPPAFFGTLNPIVVEIMGDSVNVLVYPPGIPMQSGPDLTAQEPTKLQIR